MINLPVAQARHEQHVLDRAPAEACTILDVGGGQKGEQVEVAREGQPLELVTRVDVTDEAAPTCRLVGDVMDQVASPLRDLIGNDARTKRPRLAALLGRLFRKRLDTLDRSSFQGRYRGDAFREHCAYLLLIRRRTGD